MQGTLIVMEGIDGSGKSTQYELLRDRLRREGRAFRSVSFPRYSEESSALVRAYLAGDYGTKPEDVNAYAASTFYAVDRFASYRTDWGAYYNSGGTVLCARYTTSNACHQGSKLRGEERERFLNWLTAFEYGLLGLPEPDLVLYLDIDLAVSRGRLNARQDATHTEGDIHEKDAAYQAACLEAGRVAAAHYGWRRVSCVRNGELRSAADIHEEIYRAVADLLK